jgi:glycerophosphoryl diester phosphodiesterase
MQKPWRRIAATSIGILVAFVFLNNTSLLAISPSGPQILLAHRGIAQRFDPAGVGNDTCTASRILPPTNSFIENTIASMRASFDAGADVVEFDVHPTTDGRFAVFHDWTLDCRTNGQGVTRTHTLAYLKSLDIGYGYTADGGKSFPFRGREIGMMPSLDEVLATFPGRDFLINVKSNDGTEGELLARRLGELTPDARKKIMVYGGNKPITVLRQLLPDIRTMSTSSLKSCLVAYVAYGWTGIVPSACDNIVLFVPTNVAPWLWGWPGKFVSRMAAANSRIYLVGPYHGGGFSTGIDTENQAQAVPQDYSGGILTNDIATIAAVLKHRPKDAD